MTTLTILLAQYEMKPSVPFVTVARDIFNIEPALLLRRLKKGDINAYGEDPARLKRDGVPLVWLAELIEDRRQRAQVQLQATCKSDEA